MKTETLHKLIESNLEWLYQQMSKYHVEDPQECVHDIVVQILSREELYAKAPEGLPVAEFRKWFSAYVYWQFRADQRHNIARLENTTSYDQLETAIPALGDTFEQSDMASDLDKAFLQFPQPFRTQLREVLEGKITFEQLAKETGEPLGTVTSRVHRAKAKLQKTLSAYSTKIQKGVHKNSTEVSYR